MIGGSLGKHQVFLINGALGYVSLCNWGQVTESVSDENYTLSPWLGEKCQIWTDNLIVAMQEQQQQPRLNREVQH